MDTQRHNNPWLGLESYKEGEVLYGRDDDIRDLTQCVLNSNSTLLHGKSGIGKSSILNAGVVPAARRQGYLPVPIRLSHKTESTYLQQINEAIELAMIPLPIGEDGKIRKLSEQEKQERKEQLAQRIKEVVPCSEQETVYEYFHRHTFHNEQGERINLLIIFDQFEEIFTLQTNEGIKRAFFAELADMLNDVVPANLHKKETEPTMSEDLEEVDLTNASDLNDIFGSLQLEQDATTEYVADNDIHFVFTIREDFLSEFEYYSASIPVLKQNRYGLRPINEEQAAQIILRPIPGLISIDVAKLIIEKVTGRTDFELDDIPEIEVDSAVLSLYLNRLFDAHTGDTITAELVEEKGGEIISDFYNEAIADISSNTVEYLEEMLLNGQGRRDNITLYDAIHDGNASNEELDILCNKKKILRQFNYAGVLRIEYVHDILCPIVKAHKEERKVAEEKAAIEAEALRKKKIYRWIIYIASIIALIIGGLWLKDLWDNEWIVEEYYAEFNEDDYGWPKGVGKELSKEDREHTPLYYRLWRKGHKGDKFTDVEIMSSNKYLPHDCRISRLEWSQDDETDKNTKTYNDVLRNVTRLHYTAVEGTNKISKVEYFNKNGLLMTVSYYHLTDNDAWANLITPKGQNMKIRDNGIDRVKISWNSHGVQAVKYYDALGVQQDIYKGRDIKGFEWKHPDENTVVMYSLNEFGLPTKTTPDNTKVTITRNDSTYIQYYTTGNIPESDSLWNQNIKEVSGRLGYSKSIKCGETTKFYEPNSNKECCTQTITKKDDYGNIVEIQTEGSNLFSFSPRVLRKYDNGLLKLEEHTSASGRPFGNDSTIYKWEYDYHDGVLKGETHYDVNDVVAYCHTIKTSYSTKGDTITIEKTINVSDTIPYIERIDSVRRNYTSITFYGENRVRLNKEFIAGQDTLMVHRILLNKNGCSVTYRYYKQNGGLIEPLDTAYTDYGKALSYFKRIEEYDENNNLIALRFEDKDGNIMKNMMYFIQNGQCIGRAVKSIIDGNPVRCDKWEEEGYLYYRFYYNTDFDGNDAGLTAVDEWGERSTTFDGGNYIYAELFDFKKKHVKIYDNPKSNPIWETDFKNHYKQLAQYEDEELSEISVPYIHILSADSKLYKNGNGLKDGDRIVEFGEWCLNNKLAVDKTWEDAMSSSKKIHIKVLRPNIPKNSYVIHEFDLLCDKNEMNKVEIHTIIMSKSEASMFKKYYQPK